MADDDKRKIGIRIPDTPWRREWVWAEPVSVSEDLTVYRLLNSSVFTPYVVDDLVTVRRSGTQLMLAGLYERGGRTGHLIEFSADLAQRSLSALVDEWTATGTAVERLSGPFYSVATDEAAQQRPTSEELARLANEGLVVAFELITDPDDAGPADQLDGPSQGVAS